jgi:phospholipase D1/2
MEANSGVKFREAQIALARQWIGDQSDAGGEPPITEVFVKLAQPTAEGIVETKATETKVEKVPVPESEEKARETIERFEHGADSVRSDEEVADTVSQHMLADRTGLLDEKWLGTEQEERDA